MLSATPAGIVQPGLLPMGDLGHDVPCVKPAYAWRRQARRALPCSTLSTLKNAMVPWSCSAWDESSSAVDAISSAAPAFCWITWFSCWMALLIWSAPRGLLLGRRADLLHQLRRLLDVRHQLGQHLAGLLRHLDARGRQLADLACRGLAALGQLPHFRGHDGEALAVLAGPRGLDGRVQGQQVGLARDLLDDRDLRRDLLHGAPRSRTRPCRSPWRRRPT